MSNQNRMPYQIRRPTKLIADLEEDRAHLCSLDGINLHYMDDEEFDKLRRNITDGFGGKSGPAIALSVAHNTYSYMARDSFNPKDRESVKITAMMTRTLDAVNSVRDDETVGKVVTDAKILARTRMRRVDGFMMVKSNKRSDKNG